MFKSMFSKSSKINFPLSELERLIYLVLLCINQKNLLLLKKKKISPYLKFYIF